MAQQRILHLHLYKELMMDRRFRMSGLCRCFCVLSHEETRYILEPSTYIYINTRHCYASGSIPKYMIISHPITYTILVGTLRPWPANDSAYRSRSGIPAVFSHEFFRSSFHLFLSIALEFQSSESFLYPHSSCYYRQLSLFPRSVLSSRVFKMVSRYHTPLPQASRPCRGSRKACGTLGLPLGSAFWRWAQATRHRTSLCFLHLEQALG